ncbi:hypothetical protein D3C72_2058420 [compost metagenome]
MKVLAKERLDNITRLLRSMANEEVQIEFAISLARNSYVENQIDVGIQSECMTAGSCCKQPLLPNDRKHSP